MQIIPNSAIVRIRRVGGFVSATVETPLGGHAFLPGHLNENAARIAGGNVARRAFGRFPIFAMEGR